MNILEWKVLKSKGWEISKVTNIGKMGCKGGEEKCIERVKEQDDYTKENSWTPNEATYKSMPQAWH